jgi:hypothetical protein
MADRSLRPSARPWTPSRVADTLVPLRDHLVAQLPREIAGARSLTRDQCEIVIDEAIDYMVTEYAKPIPDRLSLDRAFWATASFRVKRAHEGRGATVRAGWQRVDVSNLNLTAPELEPELAAMGRIEHETLLEFAATLTPDERNVLACKYQSGRELGRVIVARHLGLSPVDVRRHERSIARKLEQFAAIVSAGSLCEARLPGITAMAESGEAGADGEAARLHLRHCIACRAAYAAHVRAVRSGAVQRRLGQLLPVPPVADETARRRGTPWEAIWDWLTRTFAHESAVSLTQMATASRGLGTILTVKLAALCLASGAIVGGYCVDRLVSKPPALPAAAAKQPRHPTARTPVEPSLPTAGDSAATRRAPANDGERRRLTKPKTGTAFARGPAATRHERETPISPPVTTSTGRSVPEFGPGPSTTAAAQPAAAAATGPPEFP